MEISSRKSRIEKVAQALQGLHLDLLGEIVQGFKSWPPNDPRRMVLFHALVNDARLAWLRALSGLMTDVDTLASLGEDAAGEDAAAVRALVDHLFTRDGEFSPRYLALIQKSPEIAGAHALVRQTLGELPAPSEEQMRRAEGRRKAWTAPRKRG